MQRQSSTNISSAVSKHYEYWLGCAIKITRTREEATELLHEVILSLYDSDSFARVCNKSDARPYVCAALSMQFYSRESRYHKKIREFQSLTVELKNTNYHQEDWLGARVDNEQAAILVSRLPDFERDLFMLYIQPDFKLKKVSQETGIPEKYLKRVIQFSKEKIRNHVVRRQQIETRTFENM